MSMATELRDIAAKHSLTWPSARTGTRDWCWPCCSWGTRRTASAGRGAMPSTIP